MSSRSNFSRKVNRPLHFLLAFNDSIVTQAHCQKDLETIVDYGIILNDHLEKVSAKVKRKIIDLILNYWNTKFHLESRKFKIIVK